MKHFVRPQRPPAGEHGGSLETLALRRSRRPAAQPSLVHLVEPYPHGLTLQIAMRRARSSEYDTTGAIPTYDHGGGPVRVKVAEEAGTSAISTLSVTTVGHPHDGFVPCTTRVRRAGAKPGAVTSRVYVPAVPGTWQGVLQGTLATVAPVTCTVTSSTEVPDVPLVTLMLMAFGSAHGSATQSWPQEASAVLKVQRTTRAAGVSLGLRTPREGPIRVAAP